MKRFLGLLAVLLVPSLLAGPSAKAAPQQATGSVQVRQVVTASDLSARTARIVEAVRAGRWAEVAKLADSDVVAWLHQIDDTMPYRARPSAFPCRKTTASRPGSPVFACRATFGTSSGLAVGHTWWIYYRQVEGRWLAVNHRLESSLTAFRTGQNLGARTTKIYSLAWAEDWAGVARYATPLLVNQLKTDMAALKEAGATAPPSDKNCARTRIVWRADLGLYFCDYHRGPSEDEPLAVRYDRVADSWRATLAGYPFTP